MRIFGILAIISFFWGGCSAPRLNKQIVQPITRVTAPNIAVPPLKDIVESVGNNVVYIFTYNSNGVSSGYGTGFVIRKDGLIATAGHIASADAVTIFVRFRENNFAIIKRAEVFRKSEDADVALLKVKHTFKTQVQMEQREIKNDEPIYTLGYPLTRPNDLPFNGPPKLLRGRFLMYSETEIKPFPVQRLMLIDMNGAYGNSGSPIFDRNGKVMGIYVAVNPNLPGTFAIASEIRYAADLFFKPATLPAK